MCGMLVPNLQSMLEFESHQASQLVVQGAKFPEGILKYIYFFIHFCILNSVSLLCERKLQREGH